MNEIVFCEATSNDIPFLITTIIEAEKSGTDKLSYSTVFGLEEKDVRKYIGEILSEQINGCELSISSFLIARINGETAAALSAWIEAQDGIASAILKGGLLSYYLPKECIERAKKVNDIIQEIQIEYRPYTIQIGAGYVSEKYRGNKLLQLLTNEIINRIASRDQNVQEAWAQIFSCNTPSLKTYEKEDFKIVLIKEVNNPEILNYLPSNKKYLLKKDLVKRI
jgi:hypothetical protein